MSINNRKFENNKRIDTCIILNKICFDFIIFNFVIISPRKIYYFKLCLELK